MTKLKMIDSIVQQQPSGNINTNTSADVPSSFNNNNNDSVDNTNRNECFSTTPSSNDLGSNTKTGNTGSQIKLIEIVRSKYGYGFTLSGEMPCRLTHVKGHARSGGLCSGDRLHAVNGHNVDSLTHDQVVKLITSVPGGRLQLRVSSAPAISSPSYSCSSDDNVHRIQKSQVQQLRPSRLRQMINRHTGLLDTIDPLLNHCLDDYSDENEDEDEDDDSSESSLDDDDISTSSISPLPLPCSSSSGLGYRHYSYNNHHYPHYRNHHRSRHHHRYHYYHHQYHQNNHRTAMAASIMQPSAQPSHSQSQPHYYRLHNRNASSKTRRSQPANSSQIYESTMNNAHHNRSVKSSHRSASQKAELPSKFISANTAGSMQQYNSDGDINSMAEHFDGLWQRAGLNGGNSSRQQQQSNNKNYYAYGYPFKSIDNLVRFGASTTNQLEPEHDPYNDNEDDLILHQHYRNRLKYRQKQQQKSCLDDNFNNTGCMLNNSNKMLARSATCLEIQPDVHQYSNPLNNHHYYQSHHLKNISTNGVIINDNAKNINEPATAIVSIGTSSNSDHNHNNNGNNLRKIKLNTSNSNGNNNGNNRTNTKKTNSTTSGISSVSPSSNDYSSSISGSSPASTTDRTGSGVIIDTIGQDKTKNKIPLVNDEHGHHRDHHSQAIFRSVVHCIRLTRYRCDKDGLIYNNKKLPSDEQPNDWNGNDVCQSTKMDSANSESFPLLIAIYPCELYLCGLSINCRVKADQIVQCQLFNLEREQEGRSNADTNGKSHFVLMIKDNHFAEQNNNDDDDQAEYSEEENVVEENDNVMEEEEADGDYRRHGRRNRNHNRLISGCTRSRQEWIRCFLLKVDHHLSKSHSNHSFVADLLTICCTPDPITVDHCLEFPETCEPILRIIYTLYRRHLSNDFKYKPYLDNDRIQSNNHENDDYASGRMVPKRSSLRRRMNDHGLNLNEDNHINQICNVNLVSGIRPDVSTEPKAISIDNVPVLSPIDSANNLIATTNTDQDSQSCCATTSCDSFSFQQFRQHLHCKLTTEKDRKNNDEDVDDDGSQKDTEFEQVFGMRQLSSKTNRQDIQRRNNVLPQAQIQMPPSSQPQYSMNPLESSSIINVGSSNASNRMLNEISDTGKNRFYYKSGANWTPNKTTNNQAALANQFSLEQNQVHNIDEHIHSADLINNPFIVVQQPQLSLTSINLLPATAAGTVNHSALPSQSLNKNSNGNNQQKLFLLPNQREMLNSVVPGTTRYNNLNSFSYHNWTQQLSQYNQSGQVIATNQSTALPTVPLRPTPKPTPRTSTGVGKIENLVHCSTTGITQPALAPLITELDQLYYLNEKQNVRQTAERYIRLQQQQQQQQGLAKRGYCHPSAKLSNENHSLNNKMVDDIDPSAESSRSNQKQQQQQSNKKMSILSVEPDSDSFSAQQQSQQSTPSTIQTSTSTNLTTTLIQSKTDSQLSSTNTTSTTMSTAAITLSPTTSSSWTHLNKENSPTSKRKTIPQSHYPLHHPHPHSQSHPLQRQHSLFTPSVVPFGAADVDAEAVIDELPKLLAENINDPADVIKQEKTETREEKTKTTADNLESKTNNVDDPSKGTETKNEQRNNQCHPESGTFSTDPALIQQQQQQSFEQASMVTTGVPLEQYSPGWLESTATSGQTQTEYLIQQHHQQLLRQQQMEQHDERPIDVGWVGGWASDFDILLNDPIGIKAFTDFLRKEFSYENLQFFLAVQNFKKLSQEDQICEQSKEIYDKFIALSAPEPVNVDSIARKSVELALEKPSTQVFALAEKQIYNLMKFDSYIRFLKSDIYEKCSILDLKGKPLPYETDDTLDDDPSCDNYNPVRTRIAGSSTGSTIGGQSIANGKNISTAAKKRRSFIPWAKIKSSINNKAASLSSMPATKAELIGSKKQYMMRKITNSITKIRSKSLDEHLTNHVQKHSSEPHSHSSSIDKTSTILSMAPNSSESIDSSDHNNVFTTAGSPVSSGIGKIVSDLACSISTSQSAGTSPPPPISGTSISNASTGSEPALPSSSSISYPSSSFNHNCNRDNCHFLRIVFPDRSQTVVPSSPSETIENLLQKLIDKRSLKYLAWDVFTTGNDKPLDPLTNTTQLGCTELRVEQRVLFQVEFPSQDIIGVKARPNKLCTDVFRPLLLRYGYRPEHTVMTIADTEQTVPAMLPITVVDGQRIVVTYRDDLEEWGWDTTRNNIPVALSLTNKSLSEDYTGGRVRSAEKSSLDKGKECNTDTINNDTINKTLINQQSSSASVPTMVTYHNINSLKDQLKDGSTSKQSSLVDLDITPLPANAGDDTQSDQFFRELMKSAHTIPAPNDDESSATITNTYSAAYGIINQNQPEIKVTLPSKPYRTSQTQRNKLLGELQNHRHFKSYQPSPLSYEPVPPLSTAPIPESLTKKFQPIEPIVGNVSGSSPSINTLPDISGKLAMKPVPLTGLTNYQTETGGLMIPPEKPPLRRMKSDPPPLPPKTSGNSCGIGNNLQLVTQSSLDCPPRPPPRNSIIQPPVPPQKPMVTNINSDNNNNSRVPALAPETTKTSTIITNTADITQANSDASYV